MQAQHLVARSVSRRVDRRRETSPLRSSADILQATAMGRSSRSVRSCSALATASSGHRHAWQAGARARPKQTASALFIRLAENTCPAWSFVPARFTWDTWSEQPDWAATRMPLTILLQPSASPIDRAPLAGSRELQRLFSCCAKCRTDVPCTGAAHARVRSHTSGDVAQISEACQPVVPCLVKTLGVP